MSDDLLTRANAILQDCNQTESAREVIAELVEALREGDELEKLIVELNQENARLLALRVA
jgi:hypothetical protein